MTSWRELVLQRFRPPTAQLSLVADPDGLLLEEQVLAALAAQGYDVLTYDDPVAFRYVYETRYRDYWEDGPSAPVALIVRTDQPDLRRLPFDLLQAGRQLSFSLNVLCSQLSYPVVQDFFRAAPELLDTLLDACRSHDEPRLGDQRSLALIARQVYGLDPASLATLDELVERLLVVHYHGRALPSRLQGWLAERLGRSAAFAGLPMDRWLADRRSFFIYLEDQWRSYLRSQGQSLGEPGPVYELAPLAVDFNRPGIRSLVDTLFLENELQPVVVVADRPPQDWTAVGVVVDAAAHRSQRLGKLLDHVDQHLPDADAGYRAWLELAPAWAEALVLAEAVAMPNSLRNKIDALQQRLTARFTAWLLARYNVLHNLPYLPHPILGHQAPHFLAHRLRQTGEQGQLALVVLDGLALDQWQVLRAVWQDSGRTWRFDEQALLAVLPTVTPIARQAIFSGQLPLYFADTWQRTDYDARRWQRFWQDQGCLPSASAWLLGSDNLDLAMADSRLRRLGLVIGSVDEMVHGTVQGRGELHERVRHWARRGDLAQVVERLLAAGFDVWLTSDHGNVEAEGMGRPQEGVLVEQRGSRVRFYSDPAFLERAQGEVSQSLAWTPGGLPAGLLTLFAADRTAFANQGARLLTHGGLSLEEVIVPWIHITEGGA